MVELIVAEQRNILAEARVEVRHQNVLPHVPAGFVLEEITGGQTVGAQAAAGHAGNVGAGKRRVDGHSLLRVQSARVGVSHRDGGIAR